MALALHCIVLIRLGPLSSQYRLDILVLNAGSSPSKTIRTISYLQCPIGARYITVPYSNVEQPPNPDAEKHFSRAESPVDL
ncbi:hypothetical protein HOY80DRAFT_961552 [Tuber brumale]|nr:hypothetical protein HOY80DRAFT_961552 [Tuber brumale]